MCEYCVGEMKVCPYCGGKNITTKETLKDLAIYGKSVIDCEKCNTLFTLRDDGDGIYVVRRC